jgi:hypothetical protein
MIGILFLARGRILNFLFEGPYDEGKYAQKRLIQQGNRVWDHEIYEKESDEK